MVLTITIKHFSIQGETIGIVFGKVKSDQGTSLFNTFSFQSKGQEGLLERPSRFLTIYSPLPPPPLSLSLSLTLSYSSAPVPLTLLFPYYTSKLAPASNMLLPQGLYTCCSIWNTFPPDLHLTFSLVLSLSAQMSPYQGDSS